MKPNFDVEFKREEGKYYIGINISLLSISHAFPGKEDEKVLQVFSQLDNLLSLHPDWHFILVPHVMASPEGAQNDYVFMNQYLVHTEYKDRVTILPDNLGARMTKGYIEKLDLLVAARMHCCVAGISVATPTLFITYSNKGKGMSEYAYGHHDYELEVPQLLTEIFGKKVKAMLVDKCEIKSYLQTQQPRFVKDSTHGGYLLDNCIRYRK
jgi:polysaccharide pyruvyl transferase WcaK-like protein